MKNYSSIENFTDHYPDGWEETDYNYNPSDFVNENTLPKGTYELSSDAYLKSGDKAQIVMKDENNFDYLIFDSNNNLKYKWVATKIPGTNNLYKHIQYTYDENGNIIKTENEDQMFTELESNKNNKYNDSINDTALLKLHSTHLGDNQFVHDSVDSVGQSENPLEGTKYYVDYIIKGLGLDNSIFNSEPEEETSKSNNLEKIFIILLIVVIVTLLVKKYNR